MKMSFTNSLVTEVLKIYTFNLNGVKAERGYWC